jgi:hypothetical protein
MLSRLCSSRRPHRVVATSSVCSSERLFLRPSIKANHERAQRDEVTLSALFCVCCRGASTTNHLRRHHQVWPGGSLPLSVIVANLVDATGTETRGHSGQELLAGHESIALQQHACGAQELVQGHPLSWFTPTTTSSQHLAFLSPEHIFCWLSSRQGSSLRRRRCW